VLPLYCGALAAFAALFAARNRFPPAPPRSVVRLQMQGIHRSRRFPVPLAAFAPPIAAKFPRRLASIEPVAGTQIGTKEEHVKAVNEKTLSPIAADGWERVVAAKRRRLRAGLHTVWRIFSFVMSGAMISCQSASFGNT